MTDEVRFADTIWAFEDAQYDFKSDLARAGFENGVHYQKIGWDNYDCSIEFYKVNDDVRLTPDQQCIMYEAGFCSVFINHKDGWETHYSWTVPDMDAIKVAGHYIPKRGWRRRYVSDPTANTTNVIAGESNPGYYEINFWPEGWGPKCDDWRKTGYMRVVPDPLENGGNCPST